MEKLILQAVKFEDQEDYCQFQKLLANGNTVWESRDLAGDCPEDALLDRDMTDVFEIIKLMELAAGKEILISPLKECESLDEFEDFTS